MGYKRIGELLHGLLPTQEQSHREKVQKVLASWESVYPDPDQRIKRVYLKGKRLCLQPSSPLLRHQLLLQQPLLLSQLQEAIVARGGKREWVIGFAFL